MSPATLDPIPVLLVDDEARNLDALEAILEEPGYVLLRAGDADRALKLLLEHEVAAIVLDIKMPGVSGFELARLIKGTRRFREIPIVFLTAYHVEDRDVLTGYGAGAVDYLTKPLNPAILRHKIAVLADLFRKTRALAELNATLERRVRERTAELAASEAALRAASEQKDLFLATLAHELRNPLAPLRTGLDLILHHQDQAASMGKTLAAMNRQLDAMVRLVDDLLDVSRVSHGKLEIRKERADLASVLERAMETVAPGYTRRRQTVDLEVAEPLAAVVDVTRVAQVVANLLNNASKHSRPGATVCVRLSRQGAEARVDVIDEGAGIPAEHLGRVFDMFARIDRPGEPPSGLGVGLALSRRLAELHGGTLSAASAGEGQGATFTLLLPVDEDSSPVRPRPSEAPPASSIPRLRVVVVEDNEDSADVLSVWLEALGHEVRVARTGPDGVSLVVQERPDVVLCDIGLPGMDGVDVCRQVVRELEAPPVMVAITGWGMDADRQRTQGAGFAHHLVKPVGPDDLRSLLDTIGTTIHRAGPSPTSAGQARSPLASNP